jgi:hypothetical protein
LRVINDAGRVELADAMQAAEIHRGGWEEIALCDWFIGQRERVGCRHQMAGGKRLPLTREVELGDEEANGAPLVY